MNRIAGIYKCIVAVLAALLLFSCASAKIAIPDINAISDRAFFVNGGSGSDKNSGDEAQPFATLARAIKAAGSKGGWIILSGETAITENFTEPSHKGAIVVSSAYRGKNYAGALSFSPDLIYRLSGPVIFRDITIKSSGETVLAANFNPLVFDTGVKMENTEKPGVKNLVVAGGFQAPDSKSLPVKLDSNIIIRSGEFNVVCGTSRTRGAGGTMIYIGAVYITVEGGEINSLFGGSLYNHGTDRIFLTVKGGSINNLYTGGDATRRIFHDAEVNLLGGAVTAVNINNVVGNANVNLDGSDVSKMTVYYFNDTVAAYAEEAACIKTLNYNGLKYSGEFLSACFPYFDVNKNTGNLFVRAGAAGDGLTESAPFAALEDAVIRAAENGARINIIGKYPLAKDFAEPEHNGAIVLYGGSSDAELAFSGAVYTLSGPTSFDNIKISHSGNLVFAAKGNALAWGSGVNVADSGGLAIYGYSPGEVNSAGGRFRLTLSGGAAEKVVGIAGSGSVGPECSVNLILSGIKARNVFAAFERSGAMEGPVTIDVQGGEAENLNTTTGGLVSGAVVLRHSGGQTGKISLNGIGGGIALRFAGGKSGSIEAYGWQASSLPRYVKYSGAAFGENYFSGIRSNFNEVTQAIYVYLRDGGRGSGLTPENPTGTFDAAYRAIGDLDGTIVICGPVTQNTVYPAPLHRGKVTVTSFDGERDFRGSAQINFSEHYVCGGETLWEKLNFKVYKTFKGIFGNGYKLTLGDELSSVLSAGNRGYICIIGGRNDAEECVSTDITVKSGVWGRLRIGSTTGIFAPDARAKLQIYGGDFYDIVIIAGIPSAEGRADVSVYGGTFYGGIFGLDNVEPYVVNGEINIRIHGGTFYGFISPLLTKNLAVSGKWNVYIEGGDFTHLTDLKGGDAYDGDMASTLHIGKDVRLDSPPGGTVTFTNPLRAGADPWVFFHDGFYYLVTTARYAVGLYKAANIGDLGYGPAHVIYDPPNHTEYYYNMWSPEIHYINEKDSGEGGAGWYLVVNSGSGAVASQRAFIAKCLTDDLLGPWGHPLTGEKDTPIRVRGSDDNTINAGNAGLTGGMSRININNESYWLWVGEDGRETEKFHQIIYISKFSNPWTFIGKKNPICVPEYPWEKIGHGRDSATGKWYPQVVEQATAVYGDGGEIYVIYSGSGYWTTGYQLGQLRFLGGDPLVKANWEKKPTSIFSKSDMVNGCGGASYVTDTSGNKWACYHAYIGRDSTQGGRFVFFEPYSADASGVSIGNGSGNPAPLDTEYTVPANPMTLRSKISGFTKIN